MGGKITLVSFDTDRVKDYVFSSTKLAEIRGASAILRRLNHQTTVEVIGGKRIIYVGGGSAVAIVPTEESRTCIERLETIYRQETITGSITGVAVDLPPDYHGEMFGRYFRQASVLLRAKKAEKNALMNLVTLPYLVPCASCGRLPAEIRDKTSGDLLCASCQRKREWGRAEHRAVSDGLMAEFRKFVGNGEPWGRAELAGDITEIGAVSRPPGYIGLIYCDGNRMGEIIQTLTGQNDYRRFANGVDETLRTVTFETLKDFLPPRRLPDEDRWIYPFELLMLGGDDLILVTVADAAMEIALTLAREFEERTKNLVPGRRLSLAVGLVVAHDSYPFHAVLETAEELLKSAKKKSFSLSQKNTAGYLGALDFMVLTGAIGIDLKQLRREELSYREGDRLVRLTERPYSLEDVLHLITTVRKMRDKKFPGNKLQSLLEALYHSRITAMYHTMVIMGRLQKEHRELLGDYLAYWRVNAPPWREDDGIYSTPIGDLVEAYSIIGESGGGENIA